MDLEQNILDFLKQKFDVYNGSLGRPIDVSNNVNYELKLLPNDNLPRNIQEYEIFIEDMTKFDKIPYIAEENTKKNIKGGKALYFVSNYPQTVFDPCPYCCSKLKTLIEQNRARPVIEIAFQAPLNSITYVVKDIANPYSSDKFNNNNYEHLINFCIPSVTEGSEVKLCNNRLSQALFESFLDDVSYNQLYFHPKKIDNGGNMIEDDHFIPLLTNRNGDIISYLWYSKFNIILVLPQTKKKCDLLQKIMQQFLFTSFSEYFPEISELSWLNLPVYHLPNQANLLREKEELTAKYNEGLASIDKRIASNNSKYSFLHDLLTATGDELVTACIGLFKWLGFNKVIDKDKELDKEFNEEDVQIETEDKGLLLVEIKGIHGTSTDAQCSQIFKNVFRRREEQRRFDVFGLYIVNNERCVAPLSRTIPPFNQQQIKDAVNEQRGLCYTWQLFNLFFEIEDGIITKKEARDVLFNKGLIEFRPKVKEVAVPHKYYQSHTIVCLKIDDIQINVGDFFYYQENGRWSKVKILTIKDGDQTFKTVSTGSFGFELEKRVPNREMLYITL